MNSESENRKKNILVITNAAWRDTSATGNTFSNFFSNIKDFNFDSLYLRHDLPNNSVCTNYFCISEEALAKSIFKRDTVGEKFSVNDIDFKRISLDDQNRIKSEKKLFEMFKNKRFGTIFLLRELIWSLGKWKTKELDEFLLAGKYDVIVSSAAGPPHLQKVIQYAQKVTNASLVLFFADDNYSYKSYSPFKFFYQYLLRKSLQESVFLANRLYGASQEICDKFSLTFNKQIRPLYKGAMLKETVVKDKINNPIRLVYAGNLYYGRDKILEDLVDVIRVINKSCRPIQLEIYSNSTINSKTKKALNIVGVSEIKPTIPYEEVMNKMASADIVLHVESFKKSEIKKTKYSFSTKIIDCMSSGSFLLAIGPSSIASINYIKSIDEDFVIDDLQKIEESIKKIIDDNEIILQGAKKLNLYAKQNHDLDSNKKTILRELTKVANSPNIRMEDENV